MKSSPLFLGRFGIPKIHIIINSTIVILKYSNSTFIQGPICLTTLIAASGQQNGNDEFPSTIPRAHLRTTVPRGGGGTAFRLSFPRMKRAKTARKRMRVFKVNSSLTYVLLFCPVIALVTKERAGVKCVLRRFPGRPLPRRLPQRDGQPGQRHRAEYNPH